MSNSLKDLGLTLEDLKAFAKVRAIKDCKSMSEGELISVSSPSKKKQRKQKKRK